MRIDNTDKDATEPIDLYGFCGAGWPEEIMIDHPSRDETGECSECGDEDDKLDEDEDEGDEWTGEVCPHCNGTNISPYERDGGSCPHCFGGKVK